MADDEPDDHKCPPVGCPPWMATFGDMMSLLVCFFVLLLSFANMDIIKFKRAMGSMSEALGVERRYAGDFDAKSTSAIELSKSISSSQIDLMGSTVGAGKPCSLRRDGSLLARLVIH